MENTQEKRPALVDVSVLLLFFNRADTFLQVFQAVREARPARLFLYQDGPRSEADMAGIEACRSIAEQVDWQCEVHRKYQQRNYGCDPS
ncbi:MAG: hemolysin activation protein, partial [Prevotella sp.]|nr:hemolysin activation protein [Prevotella sp.]